MLEANTSTTFRPVRSTDLRATPRPTDQRDTRCSTLKRTIDDDARDDYEAFIAGLRCQGERG